MGETVLVVLVPVLVFAARVVNAWTGSKMLAITAILLDGVCDKRVVVVVSMSERGGEEAEVYDVDQAWVERMATCFSSGESGAESRRLSCETQASRGSRPMKHGVRAQPPINRRSSWLSAVHSIAAAACVRRKA